MLEFLTSAWALAVVPSALAIYYLFGFVSTLLNKRKTELEIVQLQRKEALADSRIVLPTDADVEKFKRPIDHRQFRALIRRSALISGLVLGVTGLLLNRSERAGPMESVELPSSRPATPPVTAPPLPSPAPPAAPGPGPETADLRSHLLSGPWRLDVGPRSELALRLAFRADGRYQDDQGQQGEWLLDAGVLQLRGYSGTIGLLCRLAPSAAAVDTWSGRCTISSATALEADAILRPIRPL